MRSAEHLLALTLSRSPTLGGGRLLSIDGPAGSGKTMLAAAVARLAPGSRVVHMDDLYDGWTGLPRLTDQLDSILLPLAEGRPGSYRRYDWHAGRYAETVAVEPVDLLVLEGVGSGSLGHAALITTLAWVTAPAELRLQRGLTRDGAAAEPHLRMWMVDEAAHFERERTQQRADVLLDEVGRVLS
jgi:uridine kinase